MLIDLFVGVELNIIEFVQNTLMIQKPSLWVLMKRIQIDLCVCWPYTKTTSNPYLIQLLCHKSRRNKKHTIMEYIIICTLWISLLFYIIPSYDVTLWAFIEQTIFSPKSRTVPIKTIDAYSLHDSSLLIIKLTVIVPCG